MKLISHPLADSAEAFCTALDQRPDVMDAILRDLDRSERDGSGRVEAAELREQEAFDAANVADRWDGLA